MQRPQFSIRSWFIFLAVYSSALMVHRVPGGGYSLPNYFGAYEGHCVAQPQVSYSGWPMHSQTQISVLHLAHETGPCKYESTYHPLGLTVNSTLAFVVATVSVWAVSALERVVKRWGV